ncbi:unnamed protein product [Protopolystoma xenopodis]|uniref:Uncharacterized protein n=1 Tax=Protopolystoma xenopodis TaxID=117903 RepID=A0A3S5AA00_9PLAT|nr:unnamed protein product [Protopolystoma xenopodis]
MLLEVNRICLWQYGNGSDGPMDSDGEDELHFMPTSECEDGTTPGVLGDSADEPRLLASLVHLGDVLEVKVIF